MGIPVELVEAGVAEEAAQAYADGLAALHQTIVHYAVHGPARGGKNYHTHNLYPGRQVEGLTFSRKRDRRQDNPGKEGGPDLITQHKAIWAEICRSYGLELDWTSEAPGHHLGPVILRDQAKPVGGADPRDDPRDGRRLDARGAGPGGTDPAGGGRGRHPGQRWVNGDADARARAQGGPARPPLSAAGAGAGAVPARGGAPGDDRSRGPVAGAPKRSPAAGEGPPPRWCSR